MAASSRVLKADVGVTAEFDMQNRTLNQQQAFTLLEVLIALLILSIGLLALAATQITGQRGTQSALKRSQATLLANDLAERMHANPMGDYRAGAINCNSDITICAQTANSVPEDCTADEMAQFDLKDWFCGSSYRSGLFGLLAGPGRAAQNPDDEDFLPVGASARVTCVQANEDGTCQTGNGYRIMLTWSERDPNRNIESDNTDRHGGVINRSMEMIVVP